jgi:prephenate dehydrogenase
LPKIFWQNFMSNPLKQIDKALISLLGERIDILRSIGADSEMNVGELNYQLAQNSIPPFVWKSLMTLCMAASKTAIAPPLADSKRVVLVGGAGQMGSFLGHELAIAGHRVSNLGRDWQNAESLVYEADLVLICVPMSEALSVVERIAPLLSAQTALADITGVKTPIVEAMLKCYSGPVMGLHPMFGPGVGSLLSQNVVVCPGRKLNAFQWFLELLQSRGACLTHCTPAEHDQMMVTIQAIRLFLTFGLGVFLTEAEVDLDRSLELASPPYRLQLNLVSRLFAQDAALPIEMMMNLEERRRAIGQFAATLSRLAYLVEQKDQDSLQQFFELTCRAFHHQMPRALAESNCMVEGLSVLLAAQLDSPQSLAHLNLGYQKRPAFVPG